MKYKQCYLARDINNGCITQTTWIPAKYAIKGNYLKLRKDDGEWENGWKVSEIYGECDEKALPDAHKMVKSHRKATGDAMPKRKNLVAE